jgi:hypothetical protein
VDRAVDHDLGRGWPVIVSHAGPASQAPSLSTASRGRWAAGTASSRHGPSVHAYMLGT